MMTVGGSPRRSVLRLGDASYDVGASLGVPAMTAHRALTVHEDGPGRLSPEALAGRTVLVSGGAGAVGHAAIQLAVWAGATVIATVSTDKKAALATSAGADHVVNYRTGDAAAEIKVFDPKQRYRVGDIISHPEFGRGKIENVLRSSLLVRFPIGGLKSLMLS